MTLDKIDTEGSSEGKLLSPACVARPALNTYAASLKSLSV